MNLPPVETLRCFLEAARLLNFRAAARAVHLTPAALGQRIRQLEDAVGRPLFHRTTRKVVLTEAGLALVPHARRVIDAAVDVVRAGRGELGPPPFDLTLGTRHELGMSWIHPMLPALRAAQPGMTLHLYFGSGADLLIRVRTQEIDCAVGSMVIADPRLDSIRLHREDYVLVAAPALLRRAPLRRPEDASAHTLVDINAELPLFSYWRGAPGGGDRLRFARVLHMGTTDAIRALVVAGEGVASLPAYQVRPDLDARRLVRVFPRVELLFDHFRLIFRKDDPRAAVYGSLAETMMRHALR